MRISTKLARAAARVANLDQFPRNLWWPSQREQSDGTEIDWKEQHDEVSRTVRRAMFMLVSYSLFCVLTLGTPDSKLLLGQIQIPFANVAVGFDTFLVVGPLILIGLGTYLHIFLEHLRTLPPLGKSQRLPFLFNLPGVTASLLSVFIFYWLLPLVLYIFAASSFGDPSVLLFVAYFTLCVSFFLRLRRWDVNERRQLSYRFTWAMLLLVAAAGPALGYLQGERVVARSLNLADADLRGANLRNVNLRGGNLRGANLTGVSLTRLDLMEADLLNAVLIGANLSEARLARTVLRGADLGQADLRYADLLEADLGGAFLTSARLEYANLQKAVLRDATLTGATLDGAVLDEAMLVGANLSDANLEGTRLNWTDVQRANFEGANLREAELVGAKLQDVSFAKANLQGANLFSAELRGANLEQATLSGTNLDEADLRGAKALTCDQLTGARFLQFAYRDAEFACGANIPVPPD